jgi:hypothetical protein
MDLTAAQPGESPRPFTAAERAGVERAGNTLDPRDPRRDAPKVSVARAQELAVAGFAVLRGRAVSGAQYALVTNRTTSTFWDRRPMWLLLYHGIEIASSVPAGSKSLVQSRDFLVYVDADSGLIPIAETIWTAG